MSFWDKLRGKQKTPEAPAVVAPPAVVVGPPSPKIEERAPETEVERLARAGSSGGPSAEEALAMFRSMRSTSEEGAALEALARAASDRALPEALVVAAASALVDRGEPARAIPLLDNAKSPSALLLLSDLEADRGDVPRALSLVERVLLRELDHPGALERHRRHRAALGLVEGRKVETEQNTVVAAEPDSPYRLLREVARGGAGAVYEAEDRELGRKLALKVYHAATNVSGRDREQLLHEVRTAVALAGEGVVRIFDVDPDHGWIALEWAPLGAIRERIRARDRASLFPIESWLAPFALAIARVHDAGLVHLDVKPANILMLKKEMPVLADFGIARRAGEPSPPGSMGYVSPERLAKKPADFSDDVYALGRVVEDVLDALGEPSDHARFAELVAICTGPAASRPRASELARSL